jgi:hypothetical protein
MLNLSANKRWAGAHIVANLPPVNSAGNPGQGMLYENIINFANITGKDVWINIPIMATDNYVCRLARLFAFRESGADDNGSNAIQGRQPLVPIVPRRSTHNRTSMWNIAMRCGTPHSNAGMRRFV